MAMSLSNVMFGVLMVVIIGLIIGSNVYVYRSSMKLEPAGINLDRSGDESSGVTKLPRETKCLPGPDSGASYYSKGICGDQAWVNKQMRYKITGSEADDLLG